MPATEAQRRNAAMFAELRARKPGDEDTDSDSDEEVLPTKKPFSKSTVQQPVGKAVNSAAVSPRVESRNSVVAAYVSPDSSSSSENSLIDLETPESSCSSSPTTIIPIIRSNAVTQTSSKGPIVSQSGVLVPTDEKAASRPIPLMANREAPPAPTAESKQAENAVAKDGYIRYFPENERLNELQSPANPRPVSLNVHSDKTSPLRQRFREEDDRLQAQTVRAPALDRANQAQTSNGIEERPVKASLSKPSEADRLANRNARARMITAALPSGLSHIRRSIATTDVAPTPNNTPTSSASGLAASKHATATAPGIVPATSEAHRKRKVKTLTAHAKPSMLTGSVQPRLTLTKKERRDILRQAERDLQRERPQPITTPKPKRVTFENNRAEKAENEVRVLKAKLAMSGMERRNAVSEGSEGGDEASKVKGKGKAAAVDLLSA